MDDKKKTCFDKIKKALDELYEKISPDKIDDIDIWYDDLKKTAEIFEKRKILTDFLSKLKFLKAKISKTEGIDKNKEEKIQKLIYKFDYLESDLLLERLKNAGYHASEYEKINLDNLIFKIMEAVRLGKKDMVFNMIARAFIVRKKKLPKAFIDAFKNQYDINQFKVFMYAFLSGFIGSQNKNDDK